MTKRGKHMNIVVIGRDASIRASLPETRLFSQMNLFAMLNRYGSVIVKPNFGSGGAGVLRVSRMPGGKYSTQIGGNRSVFSSQAAVMGYLRRFASAKSYIVQRYIHLAQINGRPYDLRVMVQRKQGVPWTVTGKLAKVAGPNQFITNVARSRGYVLTAKNALRRNFSEQRSNAILAELDSVCLRSARQIGIAYGRNTLGFDMAVDHKGKVWVIEANPKPAIGFFRRLPDKSYYRKILSLAPTKNYNWHFTGNV